MKEKKLPEVLEHKGGYHVLFVGKNRREAERIKKKIISEIFSLEENCYGYFFDIPRSLVGKLEEALNKIFKE